MKDEIMFSGLEGRLKRLRYTLIFLLAAGLTGCANVEIPAYDANATVQEFTTPSIGGKATAFVGETLISQGTLIKTDGIVLDAAYRTEWARNSGQRAFPFVFDAGAVLKRIGNMKGTPLYVGKSTGGMVGQDGKQIGIPYGIVVGDNGDVKYVYLGGGVISETPGRKALFRKKMLTDVDDRNYKQELLYNGRNEKEIFFTYREFKNDMARSAFQQDVRYVLDESRVIGFKALKIEVIRATNQDITYRVIRGF